MNDDELAALFEPHRPRLRALAHRLLGSVPDAEDAVQDAWLRLQGGSVEEIGNLGGWLTTVTSRICVDRLRARRARPELLTGDCIDQPGPVDPAAEAEVADSVGRALLVVLDSLSPAERVAFVLHDVFAVPFAEIAVVLGRSVEATKKLGARARRRVQAGATAPQDLAGRRRVVERFLDALRRGDIAALLDVLSPEAVRRVDPVLLAPGRSEVVCGAREIAAEALVFAGPAREAEPALLDGAPGAVVVRDGELTVAIIFVFDGARIDSYEVVGDPERLAALDVERWPV
ncbi:RNA polymerase sigma-70 factor, ECF subfamily [Pseudonocardia thermophila]|jgi:RNA polymerase sigma factor, sigma-70 family|uniref:RNA polymerase sigma-70 factor, ECF subfamily n=1 Tax=Pseudonocardia thermophila TaxID=1848 RepID=A0A1M6TH65_PSETH|nr:sigma-70 family RNA polymerase sigma factor [Pseudonocardia thermophila]SHK56118.1 RNA polymerase sigma-70 factor, ECF subfamily [Pseudonocardia thermophila]